jgi:hypothetical protein
MDMVVDKGNVLLMSVYSICISILLGLFEFPSMCTCYSGCVVVAKFTRVVSGFWIPRAAALVGIAAGGIAIYSVRGRIVRCLSAGSRAAVSPLSPTIPCTRYRFN